MCVCVCVCVCTRACACARVCVQEFGAAAVRLFPAERRLVADGHEFSLNVSGLTRIY